MLVLVNLVVLRLIHRSGTFFRDAMSRDKGYSYHHNAVGKPSDVGTHDSVLCHGKQIGALVQGTAFYIRIFIVCGLSETTRPVSFPPFDVIDDTYL